MSEWREFYLEDLAELHNNKRVPLSSMQRASKKGCYPYYGASGIVDYIDEYAFDGEFVLISEDGENLRSRNTPIAFKADGKFWVNNHAHIIKGKKDFHNALIIYYLKNLDLNEFITGAVQPKLNRASLTSIPFYLPEKEEEQNAIASVLSSLDDKIDLLHRQNTTLERMAETLFRQWFVEEAQEDWAEATIADLIEFNPARKLIKNQISTYLDMAGLDTSNFNPTGWYQRAFSSGTKFINNDTLLARITPCLENGKTGYISFLSENEVGWGSTEFIVMRPKLGIHPFFAYVLARYQDFRDYAEGCMEGSSGRQRVNTDHLKQYEIKMPSNEIIKRFNDAASVITPKLELNAIQIKTLEMLRDNLLPKLMSGEVTINNEVN